MDKNIVAIGVVFTVLVMVVVGIVILGNIEVVSNAEDSMDFRVSDVTVDKLCDIDEDIDDYAVTVQFYDGISWSTLTETTDYTVATESVTVKASAMNT